MNQPTYGWLIACDEEMLDAHLGVAELSDSYETAKRKLRELIQWHVDVATDPAVNGGFSLQPATKYTSICLNRTPVFDEEFNEYVHS